GRTRPGVATGRRHEHTRERGVEEGQLGRAELVHVVADGVVDDIDAVLDRLVDGGHDVGRAAYRAGVRRVGVQHLVDGQARSRRHAGKLAHDGAVDGRGAAVVAARGAGRVRAVPEVVARRVELARVGVRQAARVEPARPDHLVVTGDRRTLDTRVADGAVPLG